MDKNQWLQDQVEKQESLWLVVVNGNRSNLGKVIYTRSNSPITRDRCHDIAKNIEATFGVVVEDLRIIMDRYDYQALSGDDVDLALSGDIGVKKIVDKHARYDAQRDSLLIWQDGEYVYANDAGVVTRDAVAIADSL